jgi:regulator of sigma E protease
MPEILKVLFICIEVVLLFNLLIIVHELGHFLAARWRGLVVEKFAIWFGKPLWKKTIGGVEYRLGSIPAGGFVAIPQLAPMEAVEGKTESDREILPAVKPLDKIIVAAAGPLFSLGLAFVFACLVWMIGRPVSEAELTTKIGFVLPEGPADKAGIRPGDIFVEVDNKPVSRFSGMGNMEASIVWNIARSEAPVIPVTLNRNGEILTVEVAPVAPERNGLGRKNLRQIGVLPAQTPVIARIEPGSPAAESGLQPRDQVVAADGIPLLSMADLAGHLEKTGGDAVRLTIERAGERQDITVTPKIPLSGEAKPRIGVYWDDRGVTVLSHPDPFSQIVASVRTMWATITAVVSPRSDINVSHLSGPVGIMRLYYLIFEAPDGWRIALWFSVILNVNLAILNLLPLPVLDGGHITLALIEAIRRKPMSLRVLEVVQGSFAVLLIGFLLYITFYDVLDLPVPWSREASPPAEMRFLPDEPGPDSPGE